MTKTLFDSISLILIIAVAVYLLLGIMLYMSQSRLLYYPQLPTRSITATPREIGLAYEEVRLTTEDGVRLHGWHLPAAGAKATLLFLHGNAGNISHRLDSLKLLHQLGLAVLIFDYRGYGLSEGQPSERGSYLDAEAAWRYLIDAQGVAAADVFIYGRSLGAAIAAHLAARHPARGLILESAFTSLPDLAADLYPWFPLARQLTRFNYDTLGNIRRLAYPMLIIHSRNDEIVSHRHGQQLYQAATAPKQFLALAGSHNDGFMLDPDYYLRGWRRFISLAEAKLELPEAQR